MNKIYKLFLLFQFVPLLLLSGCVAGKAKNGVKAMGVVYPGAWKQGSVKIIDGDLRKSLTPLQYDVTRRNGTETPFNNEYWNNEAPGIYVEIISGEPLFSSTDKFDSGTGWPSFTKPIRQDSVVLKQDLSFGMERSEVRSKMTDSHLGHVFNDGPAPTGLRYCMNSASLYFIPQDKMQDEGYGDYLYLFQK